MSNFKIREADGSTSEARASGAGSALDPKTPHHAIIDPETLLTLPVELTEDGRKVVPVHTAHAHSSIFSEHMFATTGVSSTTTAPINIGDYQITVANGALFPQGSKLRIYNSTKRVRDVIQVVAAPVGNVLTLERRIGRAFAAGATVEKVSIDMNVSATQASPGVFRYYPAPGAFEHLESISFYGRSSAQPYDSTFFGISALAIGLHVRVFKGATGEFIHRHCFRVNRRPIQDLFEVKYGDRAAPSDSYSTHIRIFYLESFSAMNRLDSAAGDFFEVLVQDPLNGMISLEAKVHGHQEI